MEKKKILLIEDDDSLRQLYGELLTNEGFELETAENGKKGFEKLQKGGWDLVLVDMILPEVSGLELVRNSLKEKRGKTYKHLIFLTNMYNESQEKEALSLSEGYLVKIQMTPDVFLKEVKKYLY